MTVDWLKKRWKYLRFILRHKVGVYKAGRTLGVGRWQLLMHDMSKFSLAEFGPYYEYFNNRSSDPWKAEAQKNAFNIAWLHHIHRNKHHWNYWVFGASVEGIDAVRMPERYVREMVADWMGVSYALGKPPSDAKDWYLQNKDTMILHPATRSRVEALLNIGEPAKNTSTAPLPTFRQPGS